MKIGLRIDVDTFRGTKLGVPNLCKLFAEHSMKASFFFSVGPDNMGRHLWRLLRPVFLWKILRTRAASLYGWDILLRGTFWPGPVIGKKLDFIIRSAFDAGHEIGLHAWDHHAWQARIDTMDDDTIYEEIKKGYDLLEKIIGEPPTCSAVPGWKCNEAVLLAKNRFDFDYNSDCRGKSIFRPIANCSEVLQPQIPVTLPTYDEVVGRNGVTDINYNDYMLSLLNPAKLNVLTIHAEVEGVACLGMFEEFIRKVCSKGFSFVPLKVLLEEYPRSNPAAIVAREIPGRQGWVSFQSDLPENAVLSHT
jgi:undecaprenyl phosphate-alpha-L-ara4FN deformylase